MKPTFPLSLADEGSAVRVVALRGGPGMDRRMTEMGLHVGSELTVRQHQGSGLVVARGAARYALGSGLAHRVWVERLDAAGTGLGDDPADCSPRFKHVGKESR